MFSNLSMHIFRELFAMLYTTLIVVFIDLMQQQFVPNVIKTLNAEEKFYVIHSVRFLTFHIITNEMHL